MSKVFHSLPQAQNHLSSLRGDQPHSGQRMRGGSEAPGFFSSSSSRSGTMTGLSATRPICAIMIYPVGWIISSAVRDTFSHFQWKLVAAHLGKLP